MKLQELFHEDKAQPQQLNEWVWLVPLIATAVRVGAPALVRVLATGGRVAAGQAIKRAPKITKKIVTGTGKALVKNPGKTAVGVGGYVIYDKVTDAIEFIQEIVGDLLDMATIKTLGKAVVKYGIPAAGIIAILYGGKKLYDYMQDNPDNDVIDDVEPIEEGVNDPHIFKAVFMAGGPGAGKSYVAQKLIGGTGLKTVNSDIALTWLMNKANLRLDMPDDEKEERDQVRDRAKEITKSQEALYLQGRLGLLIDGTGKDIQKISAINTKLKVYGYETKMVFVNTDLETSLMRNQERAKQGDRTVDPAIAKDAWSKVQNNMMAYQQEFGKRNFYVVDNSDGPPSDERTQSFNVVWKDLQAFLNAEPATSQAKKWMRAQKVSFKKPTKNDWGANTSSQSTFNLARTIDRAKKATGMLSTVGRSDTGQFPR